MSDLVKEEALTDEQVPENGEPGGAPSVAASTLLIPVMLGALALGASTFLASEHYVGETQSLENWSVFGQRILRSVLQALAVLSVAVAVSARVPQAGLALERLVLRSDRRWFLAATAVFGFVSSAAVSLYALGGLPHIQDEVAMVFQAKVLAAGKLYAQTPPLPAFFDHEYILFDGPKWYSKYFLGPSLALVPGVWLGAVWLINPLFGGLTVLLTYVLGRELLGEKIARVAALLMALSPFRMSLFAMMMAHPVCLLSLALAAVGVVKVVRDPTRWGWAATAGAALGYAVNSRPLTAAVLGAVMGLAAMVALPWRRLRLTSVIAFALPFVLFVGVYFGYNKALTGDARLTTFEKWCPKDRLGFGEDIGQEYWPDKDRGNSLRKALLHNSYFSLDAMGANLAGFGYPALVLMLAAPFLARRPWISLVLGAAVLAIIVAYLFYFTPSAFAGQARYWSEAMPAMILLVAVALAAVRAAVPRACRYLGILPAVPTGRAACWLAGLVLLAYGVPVAYAAILDELDATLWTRGTRLRALAEADGLDNAVVLLPSKHYLDSKTDPRWDCYGDGFALNEPDLRNPVVYARDLGRDRNLELARLYPGRKFYRIDLYSTENFRLVPWDLATSRPSSAPSGEP